jgi:hypothetical protein
VKAMRLACMPLEIDGHFDASRMMIGGILLSAGGFCCATGLAGADRLDLGGGRRGTALSVPTSYFFEGGLRCRLDYLLHLDGRFGLLRVAWGW